MVLADDHILPRLCVIQVLVLCFMANFEEQFVAEITDNSYRNYSEFCFFYWSLLSKVKNCLTCLKLMPGANLCWQTFDDLAELSIYGMSGVRAHCGEGTGWMYRCNTPFLSS